VVALTLLLAVGVVGWAVAKPYLVAREAGAAAQLDPRAQAFLAQGEAAVTDGNLDIAQEDFDKASALAEHDPRVLLDQARLTAAKADVPWLKLRLLSADAVDDIRTTRAQLDDLVVRARRQAEDAVSAAARDPAAIRSRVDALRLSGDREGARAEVARMGGPTGQAETAYVLAALDLAEPSPLWATAIERLRSAAAVEGNGGRARAALIYALARSGDGAAARAEIAKLDALPRPYPLLPNLRAFVDKSAAASAAEPASTASAGAGARASAPPHPSAAAAQQSGAPAEGTPSDPRAAMQAAAVAIKKADFARARTLYQTIVDRNPNDSEAVAGLGDVARLQGDTTGAVAAYKRAIAINPSYLPALLGVADTEWSSGNHAAATKVYADIVDRFPEGTYPAYVTQRAEGGAPAKAPATPPEAPAQAPAPAEAPGTSGEHTP
jgi:tetratricopeptide (TPR) repeat protein